MAKRIDPDFSLILAAEAVIERALIALKNARNSAERKKAQAALDEAQVEMDKVQDAYHGRTASFPDAEACRAALAVRGNRL
jgi:hypothetical protein